MLVEIHGLVPYAGIALFAGIALAALGAAARSATVDRVGTVLEAVQLALMAATAILGLAILVTGGRPRDWLHLLYGALVLAIVPGVDLMSLGRPPRQRSLVRALAAVAGIGLVVRSFATG